MIELVHLDYKENFELDWKITQYMIATANSYKERMVWGDPSEV